MDVAIIIVLAVAIAAALGVLRLWILLRPSRDAFGKTRMVHLDTHPFNNPFA